MDGSKTRSGCPRSSSARATGSRVFILSCRAPDPQVAFGVMQLRYVALPFVLCVAACTTDDGPSQPSPVGDATEEQREAGRANDAADAPESCSPPPDAGLCAFKAGALVSETLGSCAPIGKRIPVEHIILLMQENRSFDHYLGHLKGNGQDDVDVPADGASNPSADDAGAPVPWHHLDDYCFEDTNHE